jgi:hypothetical protein
LFCLLIRKDLFVVRGVDLICSTTEVIYHLPWLSWKIGPKTLLDHVDPYQYYGLYSMVEWRKLHLVLLLINLVDQMVSFFLSQKGKLVESSNTIILCKWEELFGISCLDNSYVVFGEVTLKFRGITKVS